jgi:pseudaminic acid synthase
VKIGTVLIGEGNPPFVIAEMSGNHGGSLEKALAIVDAAAEAGAHAVKLQTFDADSMTLRAGASEVTVEATHELWGGRSLWELYDEAHTPLEWHEPLFLRAAERGIVCFSSVFDERGIDYLESLGAPAYKIASFECTDLPLVRRAASTGKPLIVSTGMASLEEIQRTVDAARGGGCRDLVLLKCTSNYPAEASDAHLRTISAMREVFGCEVGLSDHTAGVGVAVAGVALGASVVEKHLVRSREDGGVDAGFSLDAAEFRLLVTECRRAWEAVGRVRFGPTDVERASLRYRRSIYVCSDVCAGETFTVENLRRVRPGEGLEPRFLELVLGRAAAVDLRAGSPLRWEHVGAPVLSTSK